MSNQYFLRLRRARFNCDEEKSRKLINTKRLIEGEGTLLNSLCWQSSRTPAFTMAKTAFTMAKTARSEIDDISKMGDQEESRWSETVQSDDSSDSEQRMPSDTPSGELSEVGGRVRLYSESQVYTVSRWQDNEDRASAEDGGTGDGAPFRGRSQSAPAALWKAKKYGRQLRRMSDEFDTWLDRGEIRKASSTGKQTNQGWFSFLWGSKEEEGRE